ncbi:MAG: DUF1059 domain-containing protein [Anaeromyxobacteraceae bacterium]|nr:DUF1059 domain-containing protein [Anaeromyxobacteraceae bacterium]
MKDLHCRELGQDCDWVASGLTDDVVMYRLRDHALHAHGLKLDSDRLDALRGRIHDLGSSSHRESMGGDLP